VCRAQRGLSNDQPASLCLRMASIAADASPSSSARKYLVMLFGGIFTATVDRIDEIEGSQIGPGRVYGSPLDRLQDEDFT
jgi:hypothetical protein